MAKKKGKPTRARCETCIHDRLYPAERVASYPETQRPVHYCGALDLPPELPPTKRFEDPEAILSWIREDAEFNVKAEPIGRIVVPCPGYEGS